MKDIVSFPLEILGQNIRQERVKQKMTQEKLAEKAEISAVFLSQIENAQKIPSFKTVNKITSSLGITMEKAFKEDYISVPNIDGRIEILLKGKTEKEKQILFDIMNYIAEKMENTDEAM